MPAGVAETAGARGLLAEVAVVDDRELVGEQLRHGSDIALHVGDHANADDVGDLGQRVVVEQLVSADRTAFAANDATLLVRPVMLR